MRTLSPWQWSAFGKHPMATDFFRLGQGVPLLKGFSEWVEKGFQMILIKKPTTQSLHAWRFWARGVKKGHAACGVVRDSSDRVGRSFPLLIMGTGMLDGWEDHWHFMPFACERTWDQIEYLSAFVANDLKKLDQEVRRIPSPLPEWPSFETGRKEPEISDEVSAFSSRENSEGLFELRMNPEVNPLTRAIQLLDRIRSQIEEVPNAVFLGGTLERTFMAIFRRPLQTSDFIRLWSVTANE